MERSDDFLDLVHYWQLLSRRLWWMVGLTLLAGAAGFGVSQYLLKPLYKAKTVVFIGDAATPAPVGMAALLGQAGFSLAGLGSSSAAVSPLAMLKSQTFARKVSERLNARDEYHYAKTVTEKDGTIAITGFARSPKLAADVANTYVSVLQEWRDKDESSSAQNKRRLIESQLETTRRELKSAEDALRAYQERHRIMTPDASITLISERITDVEKELARARLGLGEARESMKTLRAKLRQRVANAGAPPIANTEQNEKLRSQIAETEAELAVARLTLTEEHPQVTQLRRQVEVYRKQMGEMVAQALDATDAGLVPELIEQEVAIAVGEATVAALEREQAKLADESAQVPEGALAYARLKREVMIKETVYQMLLQEHYKARIAAAQITPPVFVVDPAEPPTQKSAPRPLLNAALAMFLTFTLSVGMVLLRDWTATLRRIAYTRQKQQAARE